MIDDTQLAALLRSAVPPVDPQRPSRDLWPRVTSRAQRRATWSWLDLGLAAAVAAACFAWPDVLLLLAYHL
jgi:hypothetical protein